MCVAVVDEEEEKEAAVVTAVEVEEVSVAVDTLNCSGYSDKSYGTVGRCSKSGVGKA